MDAQSGKPISGTRIEYMNLATNSAGKTDTNAEGFYALPLLSPGRYRVRVSEPRHQAQEQWGLELPVSATLELNFRLRPVSDVWEAGQSRSVFLPGSETVTDLYGPDVDTSRTVTNTRVDAQSRGLQSSLSYVVDPQQLARLPLSGRDAYRLILFQPAVATLNRPSILLDGLDANEGGLLVVAPEAVQEYRITTSNFSAEFGRASGYIANVVTRSGTNALHGVAYGYFNDDFLNANSVEFRARAIPLLPRRETYVGFSLGGPVLRDRLFYAVSYERFRSRGLQFPYEFRVPVLENFRACPLVPRNSAGLRLLERFPLRAQPRVAPSPDPCAQLSAPLTLAPSLSVDRGLGLARVDRVMRGGLDRLMGRFVSSRGAQPDAIFSLYEDFTSPLEFNGNGVGLTYTRTLSPAATMEMRLGFQDNSVRRPRPFAEIPKLLVQADAGGIFAFGIPLPGSQLEQPFNVDNRAWEFAGSLVGVAGRHVVAAGGGLLMRRSAVLSAPKRDGILEFASLLDFARDLPRRLQISVRQQFQGGLDAPLELPLRQPPYDRRRRNQQFYGFVQDAFRLSPRIGVDLGLRYESFGTPQSVGPQDTAFQPGDGRSIEERIAGARLTFSPERQRSAHRPDRNDWAGRLGLSLRPSLRAGTVFRAAYGLFYDRPDESSIDQSQYNSLQEIEAVLSDENRPRVDYRQPLSEQLDRVAVRPELLFRNRSPVYWVDQGLRTSYVQRWFASVDQSLGRLAGLEVSYLGAEGRKRLVSDLVNRFGHEGGDASKLNPNLPEVLYLFGGGGSSYHALASLVRVRARGLQVQVAHTWSHAIDNQAAPLSGIFTRQFDSRLDRGSSDFDVRHNLVAYGFWELPGSGLSGWKRHLFGGWQTGHLAGFRTGRPFTVIVGNPGFQPCVANAPPPSGPILSGSNRASLLPGQRPFLDRPTEVPFGWQLLNPASFCSPPEGTVGNLGRNSLTGPGLWLVDSSLGKSFRLPFLGEAGAVQLRADVYNVFNSPNLTNINPVLGVPSFGQATFGALGNPSAAPVLAPLNDLPRRVQLQLRLFF